MFALRRADKSPYSSCGCHERARSPWYCEFERAGSAKFQVMKCRNRPCHAQVNVKAPGKPQLHVASEIARRAVTVSRTHLAVTYSGFLDPCADPHPRRLVASSLAALGLYSICLMCFGISMRENPPVSRKPMLRMLLRFFCP